MKIRKQIYLGYDAQGRQIRKWISADSKTELKKKIEQYKFEMAKVENPSEITFKKYSEHWFKTYKSHLARQTQDACRTHLKKCSELDPYPIRKITKSMCQRIVNEHWEHPHAAKGVADVLRQIFRSAMADGIIPSNPADALKRPKCRKAGFHLLTEEELDAIEKADLNDSDRLLVTILQVFGLRPAEALALMPKDFDFRSGVLHITKSLELPNVGQGQLKATKTEANRDIPIPENLIAPLRKQIRDIQGFLLFEKATGGLHTKSSYKRLSQRIWKAVNVALGGNDHMNLVSELSLYDFRHRRATDLYYLTQKGIISTMKAAALMGHSEIVFLRTYCHIVESRENISDIYSNSRVSNW